MSHSPPGHPAFGTADLSNCELEQIHLAGCIQPHGALLVLHEPDLAILQASANSGDFLGLEGSLLGRCLEELPGELPARVRSRLGAPLSENPAALRGRLGHRLRDLRGLLHRPPEAGLVLELEAAGSPLELSAQIEEALQSIRSAASLQELGDEAARIFRGIAGYDRAMVYRFDDEGHGEVVAERRDSQLEPFMGQRYPASDIPQTARRLYERTRMRLLSDVAQERIPVEPRLSPITGRELDMSLCFLRAMSPIHIQYLKNMGVCATLVSSLVVGGRLWGLIACHHYSPRLVQYEIRAACELISEAVATRIAALESFAQAQAELSVRRLEQRIAEVISRDGDWRSALFHDPPALLQPVRARGAALLFEEEVQSIGEVPGTQELREIGSWLDEQPRQLVFGSSRLGLDEPRFEALSGVASGLLAAPISGAAGEYVLWFRPAQVRTVVWGGDPSKPFSVGDDPADLSPRRSFARWHEQVEGTSEPWTPADLTAAKLIGQSIADVVAQFRSVRILIAQDQLEAVRSRVHRSEHPVAVAGPEGRILMINRAFERLLDTGSECLTSIADLPKLFADPEELRAMITTLVERRRPCRGEVRLPSRRGEGRPLLLRGDPVLAPPNRLLGYVILGVDLSERRAAAAARRRLQMELITPHRHHDLDESDEPVYQHLLASVLGNAQLAAMEISDGLDPSRMPSMLEGVRLSLDRMSELLEQLVSQRSRERLD